MDTDRNLLFGVLAFQAELIDAEEFAQACARWASDKRRPLADVLVDEGRMSDVDRQAVEHLVNIKLRRHGEDSSRSLAASCNPEAWQILKALEDTGAWQSQAGLSTRPPDIAVAQETHATPAKERYERQRLHARGGLGRIWVAHDRDLGRDVALKELLPERADHSELALRFLDEARITGQLEHPGIVPVYDLVRDGEDQRSAYYTMRFIRGRTLSEAVRDDQQVAGNGTRDRLRLRDLLGAFVSVCNAVAYAHARGVVHRDLKGANVVLGDYGEVIVLDWGLAKTIETNAPSDSERTPVQPRRGAVEDTLQGRILGTPAYMAPEQARGETAQAGPASDVYGLGAVLYEILVGAAPFQGTTSRDVLRQVLERPPEPPRSRWRQCPAALEAICLKALRKDPAERYDSATALAEDVRRWLADEPVSAYPESLVERAARWSRRHRTLVTTAASLVLMALLGVSLGLVAVKREQRQTERARQRAETNRDLARDAVDRFLVQVSSNHLWNQPGMQDLRRQLLESAAEYFQQIADAAGNDPASRIDLATAYGRLAQLRFEMGETQKAFELNQKAQILLTPPAGQRITDGTQLTYLAMIYHNQGQFHAAVGDRAKAAHCYDLAAQMRAQLVRYNPRNAELRRQLAADYTGQAVNLFQNGQLSEARAKYEQVLKLLESPGSEFYYASAYEADKASVHYNLALIHREAGRLDEAQRHFDEALRLQRHVVEQSPDDLQLQHNLIRSLGELAIFQQNFRQDPATARSTLEEALERARPLMEQNPRVSEFRRNVAAISNNLALLYQQLGLPDPAQTSLDLALPAWRALVEASPLNSEYRAGWSDALAVQALLHRERTDFDAALRGLDEALQILSDLRTSSPEVPLLALKQAQLLQEVGHTHLNQGRWDEAQTAYRNSLEMLRQLRQNSPELAAAESNYQISLGGLAETAARLGQHDEARKLLAEGLERSPPEQRARWQFAEARAMVRRGEVRQGLEAANRLTLPVQPPGQLAHELACLHALAASRTGDEPAMAEPLAVRALQLLNEARQAGFYRQPLPRHLLRANPDLDSIRNRAAFQEFLEAVEPRQ